MRTNVTNYALYRIRLGGVLLLLFVAACYQVPSQPANPTRDCSAPLCSSFDPGDSVHYRLCEPNGGEVLRVGDTVIIRVCSEDPSTYNLDDMEKQISIDNGNTWIVFYTEDNLDVRPNEKHWIVPDSLEYLDDDAIVKKVSIVSPGLLLRVAAYGEASDRAVDFDCSDGTFEIRGR